MMRDIAAWEFHRLTRHSPGVPSLIALALFPLVHLLPWERIAFFDNPVQAAVNVSSLYAIVVASMIGGDAGQLRRSMFWLFQKGLSPQEYSLRAFLVSLAFGATFIAMSGIFAAIASLTYQFGLKAAFVSVTSALLLFSIFSTVLLLLGSLGAQRRTELMMLLIFLPIMSDVFLVRTPPLARKIGHLALPPVTDAYRATSALFNAVWHNALGHLLHILIFLAVCLLLAFVVQRKRVPVPAKLRLP
jgi:hypothetical protein